MASRIYERASVYLEGHRAEPKQIFVEIADRLEALNKPKLRLLDVGCAAGEFPEYAQRRFENAAVTGVDIDQSLIDAARERVPAASFCTADANDLHMFEDGSFDAVTMTGVHSIFDDFRTSFSECIRVCVASGTVIISGLFNDYPIDMLAYWRYANNFDGDFSRGYNVFSKESVSTFLSRQVRVESFKFEKFVLPFDLEPQEDRVRSWTEINGDGDRIFRNGLMELNFQILVTDIAGARNDES